MTISTRNDAIYSCGARILRFVAVGGLVMLTLAGCGSGDEAASGSDRAIDDAVDGGGDATSVDSDTANAETLPAIDLTGLGPNQAFCQTYRSALDAIYVSYPQAGERLAQANELLPADAPEEIQSYFSGLLAVLNQSSTIDEMLTNQTDELIKKEPLLDGYLDDICAEPDGSSTSSDALVLTELAADGPTLTLDGGTTATVLSVRTTNVEPESVVTDFPVVSDSGYILLELQFRTTEPDPPTRFGLKLTVPDRTPDGITRGANRLLFTVDGSSGVHFEGNESVTVIAAFDTDDLITDLGGVSFAIEIDDVVVDEASLAG